MYLARYSPHSLVTCHPTKVLPTASELVLHGKASNANSCLENVVRKTVGLDIDQD